MIKIILHLSCEGWKLLEKIVLVIGGGKKKGERIKNFLEQIWWTSLNNKGSSTGFFYMNIAQKPKGEKKNVQRKKKMKNFAKKIQQNFFQCWKKLSKILSCNKDHKLGRTKRNINDEEEEEGEELL